jgi:hypothetical protein
MNLKTAVASQQSLCLDEFPWSMRSAPALVARTGNAPVLAGELAPKHLLDPAGLAQLEQIRLAAPFQLDDKWLVAETAVPTHQRG